MNSEKSMNDYTKSQLIILQNNKYLVTNILYYN